ncbi:hypothetical protein D8B26_005909 [Coccidioides posadasii str. Silveira]|uniref:Neutral amino acid permease n=1 Tax=Coccidioides posadasii (strain RMSCC 757 / Silveira) TaxID=443226 RepID=E9DIC2_COCPS|nr:neutral amino acid permease [Coccidioides posadasii str. Silveira]QVM11255.1 hypothetical protein D8B26_005909 [Coccidioides posadasii str. Silveira]
MEIWLYFRSKRPYTQQQLDVEKTGLQAASLRDFDARQRWSIFKSCNVEAESECNVSVTFQVEMEAGNSIKYRTCSWQKTAGLLFSEYICLAIVSFPYSYAVLGLIPGLILTAVIALIVLYTSIIIWQYCLRHPTVRDVCDIGQQLFWNSKAAWYITAIMFLLNNTFIQGLHCLVGAQYLNTMTNHSRCTVAFAAVTAVISFACSLPRTFNSLAKLGGFSAFFTFLSVLLLTIFAAQQPQPARYNSDPDHVGPDGTKLGGEPRFSLFPAQGTTFVAAMGAFLNISYTFIGQITLPSFIAEMNNPKDFYKALLAVTFAEVVLFSLVGSIIYVYNGQYTTSPAFATLSSAGAKGITFSLMVPTLLFLGVLYSSISARFIFFRLFEGTCHKGNHTVVGWLSWAGILAVTWIFAFVIAEVIPFFADLLSIMSSLFDSLFGFIFWGMAYIRIQTAEESKRPNASRNTQGWIGYAFSWILIGIGLFFLGPGTYASIRSVILNYEKGNVGSAFSCEDTGL